MSKVSVRADVSISRNPPLKIETARERRLDVISNSEDQVRRSNWSPHISWVDSGRESKTEEVSSGCPWWMRRMWTVGKSYSVS